MAYARLPPGRRAGTLHPQYVLADASRSAELRPAFWLYEDGGETLLHGFHLAAIPETGWHDLQSPYGYGGPLASTEAPDFLRSADLAFREWAIGHGVVAEFIRFHPLLENWRYYGGEQRFDRHTVWVECGESDHLPNYDVRQRTAVRKAIKAGAEIRWLAQDEAIARFPGFYRQAMQAIGADGFYLFPDDYFAALFSLPFAHTAAAVLDGEIVAMALFLCDGIGEYHLSGKTAIGGRWSATNLLLHEAFRAMPGLGIDRMHLGGGSTAKPDDPLLFFKSGFSRQRAEYRIGWRILIPDAYEALKRRYATDYARQPRRILFYRS